MKRALVLMAALAGCTQQGTGVELFIDAGGLAPDRLTIAATYDGRTVTHTVDVVATSSLDVIAQLPDESTTVTFDVAGFAGGQEVGRGMSQPIAVTAHRLAQAMITLVGGGGGDGSMGPPDLADGGALWTHQHGALPPSAGTIRGLWGPSGGEVYAVGPVTAGSNVFRTTDHGATWTPQLAGGMVDLNAVGGTSPTDVYLVGDGATILHGSGTTWTAQTNPALANTRLLAIWAIGSTLYVAGSGNTILRNSGSGWVSEAISAGTTELRGIWGVSGHLWAVGSGGAIVKSTGGQWTADTSGTTNELRGIFGTSATDVWVVGDGVVLHFDGNSWSPAGDGVPASVNLRAVGGLPGGPVWAVGNAWTVVRRDANAWVVEPTGLVVDDLAGDALQAIWAASLADVYAGGAGETILHRP